MEFREQWNVDLASQKLRSRRSLLRAVDGIQRECIGALARLGLTGKMTQSRGSGPVCSSSRRRQEGVLPQRQAVGLMTSKV